MIRIATLLLLLVTALPAAADEAARIVLPPASLAKWYPPQQERPEFFLHMRTLGRAMQATAEYATLKDRERLTRWAERLAPAYKRVATMVPEWEGEIELEWADRLVTAARSGDFATVDRALDRLGTSCRSCHNEYRPAVRILYHVPDYRAASVESSDTLEEIPYPKFMGALARDMNRIGIAIEDGRREHAVAAAEAFGRNVVDLGASCGGCHGDKPVNERLFGDGAAALEALRAAAQAGDGQRATAAMNRVGGYCSVCHGIHKPAAAIRAELAPKTP